MNVSANLVPLKFAKDSFKENCMLLDPPTHLCADLALHAGGSMSF